MTKQPLELAIESDDLMQCFIDMANVKYIREQIQAYAKEKASLAFDAGREWQYSQNHYDHHLIPNKQEFLKLHFPNQ